jgi:hypothetical protein
MDEHDIEAIMATPISQELLGSSIPARLAYTGIDGDPRVCPSGSCGPATGSSSAP